LLEQVKKTKKRVTVVSQNHPQVGIVSLDDLNRLDELDKQARYQQSTKSLLEVAKKVREVLKNEKLPEDFSTRHDHYHYE
jgi:PHD/YefM family antitoxin component YafN of YafNO toxin-antitoxin module